MTPKVRPSGAARTLLIVAGAIVVSEAVTCVVLAILSLADLSGESAASGVGVAVILAAYGLFQAWAAWQVNLGESWARSPLVVTQIIQLIIAFNLDGVASSVTTLLAVSAAATLVCLLSPPVTRALSPDEPM